MTSKLVLPSIPRVVMYSNLNVMHQEWQNFFRDLVVRVGGYESTPLDEISAGSDHGELDGLDDDDHTQYHNNTRGDARYSQTSHDHDGDYLGSDELDSWEEDGTSFVPKAASYDIGIAAAGQMVDVIYAEQGLWMCKNDGTIYGRIYNTSDDIHIQAESGAGDVNINSVSGKIQFFTASVLKWTVEALGNLVPAVDVSYDIGDSSHGVRVVYVEKLDGAIRQSHVADASASHSITDPADTPASADALRDDLVANAIPEIEAALDALGTKINSIIATLEAAGLHATS